MVWKRQVVEWGREGSSAKLTTFIKEEQNAEPELLERPRPQGRHLVAPRVGWNVSAGHSTQLLPDGEGIMPSGQGRQKGEAADAKVPIGQAVQLEAGRPLKPRTTMERTMARSLGA
jgi:hypothetical protein